MSSHYILTLPAKVCCVGWCVYTWSPRTIQLSGHSHVCLLTFPPFSLETREQNECSAAVEFFDEYQSPPSLIIKFLSFLHKNTSFLFLICMQVWAMSREANAVLSKPTKSSGIWLVRGKGAQHSWSSWQWNSLPCVWTHPFLLGCNLRWDQVSNGSCQSNNLLCAKGFGEVLNGFSLMSNFVQKLLWHLVRGFVLVVTGIFKLL